MRLFRRATCRFLPSEDLTDQEAEEAQGGPEDEEILFVFSRIAEQEAQQEAAEEPEEEEEVRRRGTACCVLLCITHLCVIAHAPGQATLPCKASRRPLG